MHKLMLNFKAVFFLTLSAPRATIAGCSFLLLMLLSQRYHLVCMAMCGSLPDLMRQQCGMPGAGGVLEAACQLVLGLRPTWLQHLMELNQRSGGEWDGNGVL